MVSSGKACEKPKGVTLVIAKFNDAEDVGA